MPDCQKKISFVQIMHLKLTSLFPDDIKLLLVADQLQDSIFLFEIDIEVIGISKLKPLLKLLSRS